MPIKIEKRCRVCKVIDAGDTVLLKRIYRSGKYRANGEPLKDIWKDYEGQFNYIALTKHATNHQAVHERDLKTATLNKLHQSGSETVARSLINHSSVRQLVIEKGYRGIKTGKIRLKASDVVKAAKDASDIELKQKDQGLQAIEMMMKFMSGEMKPVEGENAEIPRGASSGAPTSSIIDTV